jgi:hypothetical protein
MADRERRAPRRLVEAGLQPRLQIPVTHVRDEQGGTFAELDARVDGLRLRNTQACECGSDRRRRYRSHCGSM